MLDNWVVKGWVKATEVPGHGRGGMQRDFSYKEVEVAVAMGRLTRAGMYARAAAKIARGDQAYIDNILAAVGPCMGMGELRYRLGGQGRDRLYGAARAPEAIGLVAEEPCG